MSIARVIAVVALVGAVVVAAVVLVGGTKTREYTFLFRNAGQLVGDNDVQIGGRRIGSVKAIELTSDNQARIKVEVEEPFAPLRRGTKAVIRATSLSGQANRYVALDAAPDSAPELPDGAVIPATDTTSIVDLDQLFNTFDPRTRKSLGRFIKAGDRSILDRGPQANEAARYFNPFLSTTRRLVNELTRDQDTLSAFLVNSSKAVGDLAETRTELSGLVRNANTTASAVASESGALNEDLELIPGTLRKANSTFVNLRATLDDVDPLVAESKPATRRLAPFLRVLRPLVRDARPTVADLRTLVGRPGTDNDLTDATRKLPRLNRALRPALRNSRAALRRGQPVIDFIRPYMPDLTGWLRDFGGSAATYDANGHYARVQPIFNAFQLNDSPVGPVLDALPADLRLEGLQTGVNKRCPGAATQPLEDGSNPSTASLSAEDCDPSMVPPGP